MQQEAKPFLYLFLSFAPSGFDIPKIECASALGMENGKIPDSAIVASSRYNQYWGPERGRLNEKTDGRCALIDRLTVCMTKEKLGSTVCPLVATISENEAISFCC